jgi:predicted nuclease with TOPRIM domain
MDKRHTELIQRNEHLETKCKQLTDRANHADRSNAALRGHIKRMKAELAKANRRYNAACAVGQ